MVQRWDFFKETKRQYLEIKKAKLEKSSRVQVLAQNCTFLPIIKAVYERFAMVRHKIYYKKMRNRMAKRIVQAYRFYTLRMEVTGLLSARMLRQIRYSLVQSFNSNQKEQYDRAKKVVHNILKKTKWRFNLKQALKRAYFYCVALQTRMRRYRLFRENIYTKLQTMFEKEKDIMINYLHQAMKKKKSSKQNKILFGEISDISLKQRDAVLVEYFEACKIFNMALEMVMNAIGLGNNVDNLPGLFEDPTFAERITTMEKNLLAAVDKVTPEETTLGQRRQSNSDTYIDMLRIITHFKHYQSENPIKDSLDHQSSNKLDKMAFKSNQCSPRAQNSPNRKLSRLDSNNSSSPSTKLTRKQTKKVGATRSPIKPAFKQKLKDVFKATVINLKKETTSLESREDAFSDMIDRYTTSCPRDGLFVHPHFLCIPGPQFMQKMVRQASKIDKYQLIRELPDEIN